MKKTIKIEGMTCGHCVSSVDTALNAVEGVTEVKVDLEANQATVEAGNVSDEKLKQAIEDIGFDVVGID